MPWPQAYADLCNSDEIKVIVKEAGFQYCWNPDEKCLGIYFNAFIKGIPIQNGRFRKKSFLMAYHVIFDRQKEKPLLAEGPEYYVDGRKTAKIPDDKHGMAKALDERIRKYFSTIN